MNGVKEGTIAQKKLLNVLQLKKTMKRLNKLKINNSKNINKVTLK